MFYKFVRKITLFTDISTVCRLPRECQGTSATLYSMVRAVTVITAAATRVERKKCRGGGMKCEWQQATGAYVLVDGERNGEPYRENSPNADSGLKNNAPNVSSSSTTGVVIEGTMYSSNGQYQHRVLGANGEGSKGFITFPSCLTIGSVSNDTSSLSSNGVALHGEESNIENHNDVSDSDETASIRPLELCRESTMPDLPSDVEVGTCSALLGGLHAPSSARDRQSVPPYIQKTLNDQYSGLGASRQSGEKHMMLDVASSSLLFRDDVILVEAADTVSSRVAKYYHKHVIAELKGQNSGHLKEWQTPSMLELSRFERQATAYSHIARFFRDGALPLHPPIDAIDRGIQESELLTFSSLSICDIHKYLQLHQLDETISKCLPVTANFTGLLRPTDGEDSSLLKRRFFKDIPAFTFSQVVSQLIIREPKIATGYYPLSDSLLVAFMWPPPFRRMEQRFWDPTTNMRLRASFRDYQALLRRQEEQQAERSKRGESGPMDSLSVAGDEFDGRTFPGNGSLTSVNLGSVVSAVGANSSASSVQLAAPQPTQPTQPTQPSRGGKVKNSPSASDSVGNAVEGASISTSRMIDNCDALKWTMDVSPRELQKWKQQSFVITPAGKSLVTLRSLLSSKEQWLTVHEGGYLFGLRKVPQYGHDLPATTNPNALPLVCTDSCTRGALKNCFVCHTDDDVRIIVTTRDLTVSRRPMVATLSVATATNGKLNGKLNGVSDEKLNGDETEDGADEKVGGVGTSEESETVGETADELSAANSAINVATEVMLEATETLSSGGIDVNVTVGSRSKGKVRANLSKGNHLTVKPDGKGTVCITTCFPSGIISSVDSNGSVRIYGDSSSSGVAAYSNALVSAQQADQQTAQQADRRPTASGSGEAPTGFSIGEEDSRHICAGATVVRTMKTGPFLKDILYPDGTRLLQRRLTTADFIESGISNSGPTASSKKSIKGSAKGASTGSKQRFLMQTGLSDECFPLPIFFVDMIAAAPSSAIVAARSESTKGQLLWWQYVKLKTDGSVLFYFISLNEHKMFGLYHKRIKSGSVDDSTVPLRPDDITGAKLNDSANMRSSCDFIVQPAAESLGNIAKKTVDAETLAVIVEHRDGRVVVTFADKIRTVYFSDGTKITTDPSGDSALVEFLAAGHPTVEVDLEIDRNARGHSKGLPVPIAKGGQRVRTRVCQPDGSVVLVKYDTKITSTTNGTIKLVRRDRTSILAQDGGVISFAPANTWTQRHEEIFSAELADCHPYTPPPRPSVSAPSAAMIDRARTAPATTGPSATTPTNFQDLGGAGDASFVAGRSRVSSASAATILTGKQYKRAATTTVASTAAPGARKTKFEKKSKVDQISQCSLLASESSVFNSVHTAGGDVLITSQPVGTSFNFEIGEGSYSCKIADYEHNMFEMDLNHFPSTPVLHLAGEVCDHWVANILC